MRTVPIFKNGNHQVICLPEDMAMKGLLNWKLPAAVMSLRCVRCDQAGGLLPNIPRRTRIFCKRGCQLWMMKGALSGEALEAG